jgi:glutamyl-tRNA reductase
MTRDCRGFGSALHELFERAIEMRKKKADQGKIRAAVISTTRVAVPLPESQPPDIKKLTQRS